MEKKTENEIKFDKRNYRKHSDKNKKVIRKSLEELGAGRSVLIDADNSLIAGNGVYEQAQKLGIPVRVIETDGSELVAVKRTDLHEDDDRRKRLALADNSASDTSEFDVELLKADFDEDELSEWGLDIETAIAEDVEEPEDKQVDAFGKEFILLEIDPRRHLEVMEILNQLRGKDGIVINQQLGGHLDADREN